MTMSVLADDGRKELRRKEEQEVKLDINVKIVGNHLLQSFSCLKTQGLGNCCIGCAVYREQSFTPPVLEKQIYFQFAT